MTDLTPSDSPRVVICQYSASPHPIDDECTDVTDLTPLNRAPATRESR